jgi:hypothetical protein
LWGTGEVVEGKKDVGVGREKAAGFSCFNHAA